MIKFLNGKSTSHDISIKILELLKQIDIVKLYPPDNILTKGSVKNYFDNFKDRIKTFKDNVSDAFEQMKEYINTKLFLYPTKAETDNRYEHLTNIKDFVKKNEINPFFNTLLLNTNQILSLNNTSGPLIKTPDFSMEVRPNLIKIKNGAGKDLFTIEDGVFKLNGKKVILDKENLSTPAWTLLRGSVGVLPNNKISLRGIDFNDLLIVYKYWDAEDSNGHPLIAHIPYYAVAGDRIFNQHLLYKIEVTRDYIVETSNIRASGAKFLGVYYR